MRKTLRSIALLIVFAAGACLQAVHAQSVLNPADPVITYDPNNPPTQPPYGQIGKWVRTVRMDWNTDNYKAYIYKGMAFRLHFPKTYNPSVNDGKKYPIMIFFHGHGEYGPITDNEFHLLHGHQGFDNAIFYGAYDGYIISPQSTDFFGAADYTKIIEIIEYMIANNKVDPFHITANGLSQGGQACWEILHNYPTYICASSPMSWSSTLYTDQNFINTVKYTPLWVFQGGKDDNPTPFTTHQVRDAMVAAGANFKLTEYPDLGHGTWYNAWAEPDFWPFNNKAYSSNPWQVGGKTDFWPGTPINATLGLAPGFSAYQWRKDGVVIQNATSNTLNVTTVGVYDARVQRNGLWSEWSRIPVTIKVKTFIALPAHIEAENWGAMGGPSGVSTEWTADASNTDVGWIDQGDWLDYNVNSPSASSYTLTLRIATPNTGAQLQIKKQDGTVLSTVNLPNTGGWQNWQTVSTNITLPAGNQIIRFESSAVPGWNFNWLEFTNGAPLSNQPPTVNAGPDQTITLPTNSAQLNGSGSDPDGSISAYAWSKVSGPSGSSFSNASVANPTVNGLTAGTFVFRLTVTDNKGATASDDVTVTVNSGTGNQPPTVSAGADKTITLPVNSVQLSGSASDADGSIASYSWTKVSGGSASIASPNSASTTVSGLVQGSYVFRLTATDNQGASSSDDVVVTVNASVPPSSTMHIEAENWSSMSGVLTETVYDAGGGLNVGWIDLGDWMEYSINPSTSGTYTVKFRIATPNNGAQFQVKNSGGTVLTTVNVPNTGAYQTWQTTTATITLQAGAQTIRLQSSAQPAWNINWLELTAGGTIGNQPPTVSAGADKTITLPVNSVQLSGSASDADGTIASYSWTKVSGPAGSSFSSATSASTTVNGLVQGSYTFRLTATDNGGASSSDDVMVTVNASVPASSTMHIEAEDYSSMSGIQTETTYDAGGGRNVGWIDNGDWMEYSINPSTSGSYSVKLRVATPNNGAQLQIKNSNGTVLSTVNLPNTGAYQTWQTTTTTLNLSAGAQTIRIQSSAQPFWNINWLELTAQTGNAAITSASARTITEQQQHASSLSLFPNPVKDRFTLMVDNDYAGNVNIQVIGMNGAVQKKFSFTKEKGVQQKTLSIGNLPKGQYVLTVQMEGWKETKALIKM